MCGPDDLPRRPLPQEQVIPGVDVYLSELTDVYPLFCLDGRAEQRPAGHRSPVHEVESLTLFGTPLPMAVSHQSVPPAERAHHAYLHKAFISEAGADWCHPRRAA